MVCLDKAYWKCQNDCVFACEKNCSDGFDHEVPCNNPSLLYIVNPRVYTVLYTCIYYVYIYIYTVYKYTVTVMCTQHVLP